jgi:hypothetical protein
VWPIPAPHLHEMNRRLTERAARIARHGLMRLAADHDRIVRPGRKALEVSRMTHHRCVAEFIGRMARGGEAYLVQRASRPCGGLDEFRERDQRAVAEPAGGTPLPGALLPVDQGIGTDDPGAEPLHDLRAGL